MQVDRCSMLVRSVLFVLEGGDGGQAGDARLGVVGGRG